MENYVYSFVEEDAADKIFEELLQISSDHFKQPKITHIDRNTFDRFFKNVIIKPEYHDITSFSDAKSFIKVEYDDETIAVYKLKSSDKRKLVYSIADENDFVFKVENAVAQKIFEDTVEYDKKNLIDIEKIKEFYEKCEKKFEEYEKTGGWEPFTPSNNDQSIKSDAGKLRLTLVPREIIRAIARARMYGLKKYGDKESWRSVSIDRYNDALCRHILLYLEDPDGVDEESGLSHLDHVACNVAFLCELKKENKKKKEELRVCGYCKHCICGDIDTCELDGSYISFWQADICSKFEPKEGRA